MKSYVPTEHLVMSAFFILYSFYSGCMSTVNFAFIPSPNFISTENLPMFFIVSFKTIFFLSISKFCLLLSYCDISLAVIPPNIFPFSPAFTFKSNVILFIFSACFLNSSISKLFLCACESFFACSFRRLSFVASNASFFGNKKFLALPSFAFIISSFFPTFLISCNNYVIFDRNLTIFTAKPRKIPEFSRTYVNLLTASHSSIYSSKLH